MDTGEHVRPRERTKLVCHYGLHRKQHGGERNVNVASPAGDHKSLLKHGLSDTKSFAITPGNHGVAVLAANEVEGICNRKSICKTNACTGQMDRGRTF